MDKKPIIYGIIFSVMITIIPIMVFAVIPIAMQVNMGMDHAYGIVVYDQKDVKSDQCLTVRNSTYFPVIIIDCKTGLINAQNYLLTKNVYLKDIDGNQWKLEVHPDGILAVHCSKFVNGTLCFNEVSRTTPNP